MEREPQPEIEVSETSKKLKGLMHVLQRAYEEGDIDYPTMCDVYTDTALALYREEFGTIEKAPEI